MQWWGCSVEGAVTGKRDEENRPVFTLHYDAYDSFEEARHEVAFVNAFRLIHLEDGAEMMWKREGHDLDQEALAATLADETVGIQEVSISIEAFLLSGEALVVVCLRTTVIPF